MFLIFFALLSTPFASFQSVENIFNGKDEAKVDVKLNDISFLSGKYLENLKADNSKIPSLIQDDMLINREKRQITKKSSGIVKNNNKKRKPVRKTTTKKRKPVRKTTTKKRKPVRRTTTKKPLRTTKKTTKKQIKTTLTTKKLPTKKPLSTRRPIIQTTKSKVVDVFAEYKANLIKEINERREIYHADPLQLNATIAKEAQDFVEYILANDFKVNKYNGPLGEIYYSGPKGDKIGPINIWFVRADLYDFDNNDSSNFNKFPIDEMFTQLVWKNSKQIGCGVAEKENILFVICRFYPKGNIDGEFIENVSRPN